MTRIYLFIAYMIVLAPVVKCTMFDAKTELKKINKEQAFINKYLKEHKK